MAATPVEMVLLAAPAAAARGGTIGSSAHDRSPALDVTRTRRRTQTGCSDMCSATHRHSCQSPPPRRIQATDG